MRRRHFFTIIALSILAVGTSSCSEDAISHGNIDYSLPEGTAIDAIENYAHSFPMEINADGEWNIQYDYTTGGQICYTVPDKGVGDATIRVYVYDNATEQRRENILYIVDSKTDEAKQELTLIQKSLADNEDNEISKMVEGARRLGIGYGYNTLGQLADANSVATNAIIDYQYVNEDKKLTTSGVQVKYESDTYTGSTASELSNKLSSSFNLEVKYCGFKGEVGASFNMNDYSSNETEYAIGYVDVAQQVLTLEMGAADIIANYMNDKAYNHINGLEIVGRRKNVPSDYPSTYDGIQKLVKAYGTHLVTQARVGGRLKYVTTVDVSKIEGEYDLEAFAKCSYKNSFVKVSGEVADTLKQSYEKNSSHCKTTVLVQGGKSDKAMAITTAKSDSDREKAVQNWTSTLTDEANQTIVGLTENGLIPLWELVDTDLPGGVERRNMIKDYIQGNQIENDYTTNSMNYISGTTVYIDQIPEFGALNQWYETAVMDVYNGSQWVGRICKECIPLLDRNNRVTIIYPVLNNQPKYNMGVYLGDAFHKPAKVCWNGMKLSISEISDASYKNNAKVYLRGKNVTLTTDAKSTVRAKVEGKYLTAGQDGQYGLVKIMDKIWTIRNYNEQHGSDGTFSKGWWSDYSGSFGFSLYAVRQSYFPPIGCRVPKSADYQDIIDYLLKNGMNGAEIGRAFIASNDGVGVLGYRATRHDNDKDKVDYWTSDEGDKPKMARIDIDKRTISIIDADDTSIRKVDEDRNVGKHNPVRLILN